MNETNVAKSVLDRLSGELPELSPQARKAAVYVLENPNDVGVSTVREIAAAADVKPNTMVRLAQSVGFEGYEDFREPFRADIRRGVVSFPDRARWLQSIAASGGLGALFGDMVSAAIRNIEDSFAGISVADLELAAQAIWQARRVYVLGVGVHAANAQNFAYLASTGLDDFIAIPGVGLTPSDDLARATDADVLIAITVKPYRTEIVKTVQLAGSKGLTIIGISDSPASPIVAGMDHGFVVSVETPQFFPSSVAVIAVLETLLSFVIAKADPAIVARVEAFHALRRRLGLYQEDG